MIAATIWTGRACSRATVDERGSVTGAYLLWNAGRLCAFSVSIARIARGNRCLHAGNVCAEVGIVTVVRVAFSVNIARVSVGHRGLSAFYVCAKVGTIGRTCTICRSGSPVGACVQDYCTYRIICRSVGANAGDASSVRRVSRIAHWNYRLDAVNVEAQVVVPSACSCLKPRRLGPCPYPNPLLALNA